MHVVVIISLEREASSWLLFGLTEAGMEVVTFDKCVAASMDILSREGKLQCLWADTVCVTFAECCMKPLVVCLFVSVQLGGCLHFCDESW